MTIDMMIPGNLMLKSNVPQGEFSSKIIKAVHTDTRNTMFPIDSIYGRDWKKAINILKKTKTTDQSYKGKLDEYKTTEYASMRNNGLGDKVELSLSHPLESRNNPQPSKVRSMYVMCLIMTSYPNALQ